jgi:hypothetical protein
MDADRSCWCTKGTRKDAREVDEGAGEGSSKRSSSRGGMLVQLLN